MTASLSGAYLDINKGTFPHSPVTPRKPETDLKQEMRFDEGLGVHARGLALRDGDQLSSEWEPWPQGDQTGLWQLDELYINTTFVPKRQNLFKK